MQEIEWFETSAEENFASKLEEVAEQFAPIDLSSIPEPTVAEKISPPEENFSPTNKTAVEKKSTEDSQNKIEVLVNKTQIEFTPEDF